MKTIKNFIKKLLLVDEGPKPLFFRPEIKYRSSKSYKDFEIKEYGDLNPDKIFYIIKRSSHAGIFSYLAFVLNHLVIAKTNNFVPFVDMENYVSPYNEKDKIIGLSNSWEYYFKNVSNFTLDEIYKSKNVILSRDDFHSKMSYQIHLEKKFVEFKNKNIFLKDKYNNFLNKYVLDNNLNNQKVLGIHFRGTSYKTSRGHIFPATIKQMEKYINKLQDEENFDKIFLCTEEIDYLDYFKKKFPDKLLYLNSFRSNKNDAFKIYPRDQHRYLLGDEAIKETLILSKCHSLLYVRSNIINSANYFSDKKQHLYEIFNGFNSRNQFIARWLWFVKKNFPKKMFGLKDEIIKLIN